MIVTVGSINIDLFANVPRLPKPGETITGTAFSTAPAARVPTRRWRRGVRARRR